MKSFALIGPAQDYAAEIQLVLEQAGLFDQLDRSEITALCRFMSVYATGKNQVVMQQGESPDHMVILLTGAAVCQQHSTGGVSMSRQALKPGDCFGELEMITGAPLKASCISTEPIDFAMISRRAFNDLLMAMPSLGNKLMLRLVQMVATDLQMAQARRPRCDVNTLLN